MDRSWPWRRRLRGDDLSDALSKLSGDDVLKHIKVLASDAFEGRSPGSPGEEKTIAYLIEQFRSMGLKPGNPDGTYIQDVPLVGIEALATSGTIQFKDKKIELKSADDWVAVCRVYDAAMDELNRLGQKKGAEKPRPAGVADFRMASAPLTHTVQLDDSDVVFVGYGVVAPEYGWDDYKGLDVKGKTVVMLINDPAVPDPKDPAQLDPSLFKGKAMTYYGRWTYKYEIASEKGAAACLIVHETGPAGYPYPVVVGSWGRENFDLFRSDGNTGRVTVEAWLALDKAKELFKAGGQDFDALKEAARRKDFKPVPLGAMRRPSSRSGTGSAGSTRRTPSPTWKAPTRRSRPSTSSTPPTGTTSARTPTSRGTRSSTARPTTPRGPPPSWRSPGGSPCSRPRQNGRSCSWRSPPRSGDCSGRSTTPSTRSTR